MAAQSPRASASVRTGESFGTMKVDATVWATSFDMPGFFVATWCAPVFSMSDTKVEADVTRKAGFVLKMSSLRCRKSISTIRKAYCGSASIR